VADPSLPGPTRRYSRAQLRRLRNYIRRQNPSGATSVLPQVLDRLCDLFAAMGVAHDGNEFDVVFRKEVEKLPTPRKLAKLFTKIGEAPNPFNEPGFGRAISALATILRGKWKPYGTHGLSALERLMGPPEHFSKQEVIDIKNAAQQLAHYHDYQSRSQTKQRDDLDTLVEGLADIFAVATEFKGSRYELGKAKRSRFIQFAHVALTPFLDAGPVEADALYSRWKRLQKDAQEAWSPVPFTKLLKKTQPRAGSNRWKHKKKLTPKN